MRALGDVLLDAEPLIEELVDDHELQWGDVLALVLVYLMIHRPDARETYDEDGSHPEFYYGPRKE